MSSHFTRYSVVTPLDVIS